MSNIQKTLDSLQPYVLGIRYVETGLVVDVVYKEGWSIVQDANIEQVKGDESLNYYMLYGKTDKIGIDELLAHVDKVIKANLEREKKHELLKVKVNELKEIFRKTPLTKLNRLIFTFKDDDLVPNLQDFDINIDEEETHDGLPIQQPTEIIPEEPIQTIPPDLPNFVDENNQPIPFTTEDIEMMEEEARAERNRKINENKRKTTPTSKPKVELPPKRKLEPVSNSQYQADCDCGENEACDKCIDSKGF